MTRLPAALGEVGPAAPVLGDVVPALAQASFDVVAAPEQACRGVTEGLGLLRHVLAAGTSAAEGPTDLPQNVVTGGEQVSDVLPVLPVGTGRPRAACGGCRRHGLAFPFCYFGWRRPTVCGFVHAVGLNEGRSRRWAAAPRRGLDSAGRGRRLGRRPSVVAGRLGAASDEG